MYSYLRYEHQYNIGVNLHAVYNMRDEEALVQLQKHLLLMILQQGERGREEWRGRNGSKAENERITPKGGALY